MKMMSSQNLIYLLFLGLVCFIAIPSACTNDKLPEPIVTLDCSTINPTYDKDIKRIIDESCALSGCHVSGGGAPGIYTTYAGMENFLNDNEFKKFVIDLKNDPDNGMPPNWSTNPGPRDLSPEDFALVECWVEAGYPEN